MKRSFLGFSVVAVVLAVIATIAVADDAKETAIKKDRKQIEGTWQVVALEIDGIKYNGRLHFTVASGADGTCILRIDQKEFIKGAMTPDPTKKPKTIDITTTGWPWENYQYLGIYEIGEKTLKLCIAPEGQERPTGFSSNPDKLGYSKRYLVTLEREKGK